MVDKKDNLSNVVETTSVEESKAADATAKATEVPLMLKWLLWVNQSCQCDGNGYTEGSG
jgi:hypothetical protein